MPQTWLTPSSSNSPPTETGWGSRTTTTGPDTRRRQSASVKACSRSEVEPKASGESASARSRTSRKVSQSSGPIRRTSVIVDLQDASGADIPEADAAVDAGGGVGVGAEEDRPDIGLTAGVDERLRDRGPDAGGAGRGRHAGPPQLPGRAPRRGPAAPRPPPPRRVR